MPSLVSPEAVARTRAGGGFSDYKRRAVNVWRAPATGDPILAATLRDMGRFAAGVWVLFLHGTPGGITLGRLSELLVLAGISGRGRARSVLIYLRFIGYIEPDPSPGDGRVKRFRPAARMTHAFRDRYRREFEAAGPLDPCFGAALDRLDDDLFFGVFMTALGELSLAGLPLLVEGGPSLNTVSHRFGGMVLVAELVALAYTGGAAFPPVGRTTYSLAALSRTCGLSRTQARRILQAGSEGGFLELTGEGELMLTPLLAEHVALLVTFSFHMFQWACQKALATTPPAAAAA
jgi:hypothetical protein